MPLAFLSLRGEVKGQSFPIREGMAVTIGRDTSNTIRLLDRKLSRIHCQIEVIGGQCRVSDLNSTNGTLVNGRRVREETPADPGDIVEVGQSQFRVVEIDALEAAKGFAPSARTDAVHGMHYCEECGMPVADEDVGPGGARCAGERYYCVRCAASFDEALDAEDEEESHEAVRAVERLKSGVEIAGVRIISLAGDGLLGSVYEGEQLSMGRLVALKVLNIVDPDGARRYLDAVYASGRLVHPNITLIFDAGEVNGTYYVVREYVKGRSLEKRLASHEPLALPEAFAIVTEVAYAIDYAYEHRTHHGALCPRKVLLGENNAVKIHGFGLPQFMPDGQSVVRGSLHVLPYAAPERLVGDAQQVNFMADAYSLCAVFYHLLTGRPPFSGNSRDRIEKCIREEKPAALAEFRPGITPVAQRIINRGLSKDPRARYQIPRELLFDLEEKLRKEV